MTITLPDLYKHQEDIRDRTRAALAKHSRVILCANPGFGKTRCAKWILGASANRDKPEKASGRSLFAVHRRGLVDNAISSFAEDPELPHGVIMSGKETAYGAKIQVASIDSLLSWFIENDAYQVDITFDLLVMDECVSGDAIIETDIGSIRLDKIPDAKPSMVKTYSEERGVHFSRILSWTHKGHQPTLVVHTNAGKVQCTVDHEVYTRRGWLQAQFLSPTDEILVCADVEDDQGRVAFTAGDTHNEEPENNLKAYGTSFMKTHLCAPVGAANKSNQRTEVSTHGSKTGICRGTTSTPMVTQIAQVIKQWNLQRLSDKPSSEHCLGIRQLATHTRIRNLRGSTARMGMYKRTGLSTRPSFFIGSKRQHASQRTTDGANGQYARQRCAIRVSFQSTTLLSRETRKKYLGSGSTESATLDLRGGFVMTGQLGRSRWPCIRKGTRSARTNLSQSGFATTSEKQLSSTSSETTLTSSRLLVGRNSKSDGEFPNTCQSACGTSWCRVTKIVHANLMDVYDIEVEGSHCFFANNLLVHNCHSHHPKFARFLAYHDAKREEMGLHKAYVIGLTATPQAKGLADVYREIVLGPSTEWLIENKYLAPYRYFRATQGKLGLLVKRGGEFTKDSEAAAMEGLAGDLVRDWKQFAEGRPTVGFFPRRSHAKDAVVQLEAAGLRVAYVDGETPDDERRSIFRQLNHHQIDYLCNVQVVERGTDIPRIGCVQLCVAVGSIVRYRQLIGRGSRVHPEKTDCIVLDHGGNVLRHGFFEDDPAWSLDVTTKDPGVAGARPTIECPRCQAIYRGGKCKSCGYEPTPRERKSQGLEFDGRQLKEVVREEKKASVKTAEELMVSALYSAGRSGRIWRQAVGIFKQNCEKQGSTYRVPSAVTVGGHRYRMIRFGEENGSRRVAMLYPFTVGGGHGGEYLIRDREREPAGAF